MCFQDRLLAKDSSMEIKRMCCFAQLRNRKVKDIVYDCRFLIAFIFFVLCVLFEINGSSIGMWCSYFGVPDKDILLGVSRAIRSDEWAVSTPMGISQYYNYSGTFPYFSDTVRACPTDVFLVCAQAVKDPLIIFRPFFWGYLFLPLAKGMAFFWCGHTVCLFLVTFEFGMLITSRNKRLSLVMAVMITYAPSVQWWFTSMTGDILVYTQLSILMFWKYVNESKFARKICCLTVIFICAGGYVLTFYPPWMIPCAYILFVLIIWVLLENYRNIKMHKRDYVSIAVFIVLFAISMVYLYYKSYDTILSLMNTAYPGMRFVTGGGMLSHLFLYIANIWYAYTGEGIISNVCESSYFIDFFPVCYVLPVCLLVRSKKKDTLTVFFLGVSVFLGLYCVFGFPAGMAKVTLLCNAPANRVLVFWGFCNTLLLIRSLSLLGDFKGFSNGIAVGGACLSVFIVIQACRYVNGSYLGIKKLIATAVVFSILYFCLLSYQRKKQAVWQAGTIFIVLFAGFLVNPVRHGIKSFENIPALRTWKLVHEQDSSAVWMFENGGLPFNNAGLLVGVPVINSTNVYPDIERWHLLDPEGKYETVYNRYGHITMRLEEVGKPVFELQAGDCFSCTLSIADVRKLGISYICSNRDLSSYIHSGDLCFLEEDDGFYFYQLLPTAGGVCAL